MLIEKLNEKLLEFMECWHTPRCLIESLFNDFDNLGEFDKEKFGSLRLYQYPFPSYESLIDEKLPNLSIKQQFKLRKGVGDCYAFGARKYGKTLCVEKVDIPISMLNDDGFPVAVSSTDAIHLDGVLDEVKEAVDNHPIVSLWKRTAKKSPKWRIVAKNGWKLDGVNMNLMSKNPGHQFYGKHVKKLWIEEASFESKKVYDKRQDALSELGAVLRLSGMTNFTEHSPAGKSFHNPTNKNKIINLPQYVNPFFDEAEEKDRLKEYGGEDSIGFKVFVKGEVVPDGVSEFDMERVKQCYQEGKTIKFFEINKKRYMRFKNTIIVERPKNANRIFIVGDIGESAGSEIIILSEIKDRFVYLYNITLYNLKFDEQFNIFNWLIEKMQANVVALDCGDGTGRAIYRELEKRYPKENLVWYDGSSNLPVDFEKDDKGKVKIKKGKPVYKEERMSEWSVNRLKVLLYETKISIPLDYKFDMQISSVMSIPSGNHRIYKCVVKPDHLFDAFRIFAIAVWLKKDFNLTPPMAEGDWGTGVSSWE
jgi:hypothetical protein